MKRTAALAAALKHEKNDLETQLNVLGTSLVAMKSFVDSNAKVNRPHVRIPVKAQKIVDLTKRRPNNKPTPWLSVFRVNHMFVMNLNPIRNAQIQRRRKIKLIGIKKSTQTKTIINWNNQKSELVEIRIE